jgi:hypothetical protein
VNKEELEEIIKQEGDCLDWTDSVTGYDCAIRRVGTLGHLCGYVRVPETHPYYNKQIMDTDLDNFQVHWGLTFDGKMDFVQDDYTLSKDNREGHWIGFDCAHSGDLYPPNILKYNENIPSHEVYRTMEYVKKECENLAKQLKELDCDDLDLIPTHTLS